MSVRASDVELMETFEKARNNGNPQEQDDMDERTNGNREARVLNDDPYFCPGELPLCWYYSPQDLLLAAGCIVGINAAIYTYRKTYEYFQRKWK